MKYKYLIFTLLFSVIILFAGCSSQQNCSHLDTTYQKYSLNSSSGKCVISQTIKKDVCGNGIVEKGETFCNCPQDVSQNNSLYGCYGTEGNYLTKACSNSTHKCVLTQNDKVVQKTKALDLKNSDLTIDGNMILNSPFILNLEKQNKITIDLGLYKTVNSGVSITNIKVGKLTILDPQQDVLAQTTYNQNLNKIGDSLTEKEIGLSSISDYSKDEYLTIELDVSYTKNYLDNSGKVLRSTPMIETLKSNVGSWTVINPNFYQKN